METSTQLIILIHKHQIAKVVNSKGENVAFSTVRVECLQYHQDLYFDVWCATLTWLQAAWSVTQINKQVGN